jgi:hypothetical protein
MYRRAWYRNELLLDGGRDAVHALRAAGVPAVLLKGAAIAAVVVQEHALRPMQDFDVLVPRAAFPHAVEVLRREGWRGNPPVRDPEAHFVFQHAGSFRRGPAEVDLHWASAWGMLDADGEREFWRAARPVAFRGEDVLVLAAPDMLLQTFVHATLAQTTIPPIRWAADAMLVLRAEPALDWDRLVRMAALRRHSLGAIRCIEYLRDGLEANAPAGVLRELRRNVRALERPYLALRTSLGVGYRVHSLLTWLDIARLDGVGHMPRRAWMMLRFLRSRLAAPPAASRGETPALRATSPGGRSACERAAPSDRRDRGRNAMMDADNGPSFVSRA